MLSKNNVVYVCNNTYTGKPNKLPIKVQGDRRRAEELHKTWKKSFNYSYKDKYLNL